MKTTLRNLRAANSEPSSQPEVPDAPAERQKYVGITLRLTPAQYDRVRQYAFDRREPISALALRGLSRLMEDEGLAPLPTSPPGRRS